MRRSKRETKSKNSLSEVDIQILRLIQEDSRITYDDIAKKVGISKSTVHSKVKQLTEAGYIKTFAAILDPGKLGYNCISWVGISVDPNFMDEVARKIGEYEETQIVFTTTGDHDIVFNVIARDPKELGRFINKKIKSLKGVKTGINTMHVSFVVDTIKWTHKFKI